MAAGILYSILNLCVTKPETKRAILSDSPFSVYDKFYCLSEHISYIRICKES